jgi:catechol 2,3-dioxygenase-like lactoylglutathione lyase family enzyme
MKQGLVFLLCFFASGYLVFAQKVTRPPITGLSHMTLYSDDLQKSQQFYAGLLGWEPVPDGGAHPGIRFYANHVQYIELEQAPTKGMANRFNSIGFSTSNAEQMRSFLGEHGISVPAKVSVDGNGDTFFDVKDPEGNHVEFRQTGPNPPNGGKAVFERVSTHIIHAGFVAHNRAKLDSFYKDILGFHLYWEGGSGPGHTDWVMMQVPDGSDWLEYMLYLPSNASRAQLAGANHFAPGVESVTALDKRLRQRGWKPSPQVKPPLLGVDGKWQLDLYDPDGTRVEFMEFLPVKEPCCSRYTGKQPGPYASW